MTSIAKSNRKYCIANIFKDVIWKNIFEWYGSALIIYKERDKKNFAFSQLTTLQKNSLMAAWPLKEAAAEINFIQKNAIQWKNQPLHDLKSFLLITKYYVQIHVTWYFFQIYIFNRILMLVIIIKVNYFFITWNIEWLNKLYSINR